MNAIWRNVLAEATNPRTWIDAMLIAFAMWGVVAMFAAIDGGCK